MKSDILKSLKKQDHWARLLLMIIFAFVNYIVRMVVLLIAVIQFLFVTVTSKTNANLLTFARSLTHYSYQIMMYLTYVSEERPFPFAIWPKK